MTAARSLVRSHRSSGSRRPRPTGAGEAPPGELREPRARLIAVLAAGFSPWCGARTYPVADATSSPLHPFTRSPRPPRPPFAQVPGGGLGAVTDAELEVQVLEVELDR